MICHWQEVFNIFSLWTDVLACSIPTTIIFPIFPLLNKFVKSDILLWVIDLIQANIAAKERLHSSEEHFGMKKMQFFTFRN